MSEQIEDIRAYFDPKRYVEAWELDGKDVHVTIARVTGEVVELPSDGPKPKKEKKPVLFFSDWPKPFALGREMVAQLITMYGVYKPKDFVGKRLTLYPTREKYFGEMWDVVRIRKTIPPAAAAPAQQRAVKSIAERVATFVSMLKTKATEAEVEELWKSAPADKLRADVDPATLDMMTLEYEARLSEVKEAL